MIQNLLPIVGLSVKSIVLAYSSTVSSKMVSPENLLTRYLHILVKMYFDDIFPIFQVRQILSLCPNITHLDLTQTDVTDLAFDRYILK